MRSTCMALATSLALLAAAGGPARAARLQVVATVPDLGALAETVGGDEVEVTTLVKGPQDPHFIEARPSFIRKLHDADLYVEIGLDLEVGWAPVLLRGARNPKVMPGAPGYLNASGAIRPLGVPSGPVDRSMGDIHAYGNPHFLVDPLNGLRVAALLRDKLADLRPEAAAGFAARYGAFAQQLMERLVGHELASRHAPEELAAATEAGALDALAGDTPVEGWLGAARPLRGVKVVEDHTYWIYFTQRFGLVPVATLEPKPGIAPTTRHLGEVVEAVKAEGARLILTTAYFDPRHARWVAERTGARVAEMAHQVGSRDGTQDYLSMIDYNVREALRALADGGGSP